VTTDSIIVFGFRTPLAGLHDDSARFIRKYEHIRGSISIELMVNPPEELRGCRRRQRPLKIHLVNFGLDSDMRRCFNLKVAALLILVQLSRQSVFNVSGLDIMSLNQVAVIDIHNAHSIRQIRSCERMEEFTS
jgi:hypothetical protein